MDIMSRLELAGRNLLGCLCPENNYLPYWHMVVDEHFRAEYQFRPHCNGHNVGRWWNAMLRLEDCAGFAIPPEVEAAMLEQTWRMCDNPCGILLDEPLPDDGRTWYLHSYRETMLALGLLVRHRGSRRALRQGMVALERMSRASRDPTRWDLAACAQGPSGLDFSGGRGEPAYTHGRAIEGLLCFHGASGAPEALGEARRLADFHFTRTVNPDGSLAAGCGHHTHSYLNTVRGLLSLALDDGQENRLEAILATYRNAISAMITSSGFITHDIGAQYGGDIASAGDVAHIALLLWDRFHDPQLLDDVERIVRCRLIPSQVVAPMPVQPARRNTRDSFADLPKRFVGAIGGSAGHLRGQTCVTDFTAAALHNLIEIYRRTVDVDDDCVRVNFHFDCRRSGVGVDVHRDESSARVTIRNETGKKTLVRIPLWAPAPSLQISVDGAPVDVAIREGFAAIPASKVPTAIDLGYALPERVVEEAWRAVDATQEFACFAWRGDEIRQVDPGGRYFEPLPLVNGSFLPRE